jgi:hypothetical protein
MKEELTAVEWLQIKMAIASSEEMVENINVWFKQAKGMEQEQIAQAFEDGEHNYFYSKKTGEDFENGIEYYNEKFKKDEQLVIGNSTTSTANSYPQGTTITNL